MTHSLRCRPTQLVTLATSAVLCRLGLDRSGTSLHICVDCIIVLLEILEDIILDCPLKEVELSNGRIQSHKLNALPTAERVEHLLAIRLQVRLVGKIDDDVTGANQIGNIVLLCIVGHKPVQKTETDF